MSVSALAFAPLLPGPLLAILAALCLAPVMLALLRRAPAAGWRAAACVLVLLFLAGPQRVRRTGTRLPAVVLLAVDRSASMQIADRAALAAAAIRRLTQQAAAIPGLRIKQIDVPQSAPDGTRLFDALAAGLADVPPDQRAGIIALTDGAISDAPKTFDLPLHVLIPARGEQIDRRLRVTLAPGYGIVGQTVQIGFVIEDLGAPAGATVRVTWSQDGQDAGQTDVVTGTPTTIAVPIGHGGSTIVALTAAALPGEASLLNNRVALSVNGVRDRLRVLLISGAPHEGERSWRRLLKSDPAVDLVHFTILRPPGKDDLTPINQLALIAFPVRELFVQKIRQFDLIILDRFSESRILPPTYLENIADYVRDGGALLVSAGPEFADPGSIANGPIGTVLPAEPGGSAADAVTVGAFRPLVSALGRRHPVTENLPGDVAGGTPRWGSWYRRVTVGAPQGDTVLQAGAGGPPLLVLNRVGAGRVAMLLSDQIWLWSRGHQGGGPQAELLRRVAYWLMKEPELDENTLTAQITDGRLTVERHATTDADPAARLTVTDPDGKATMLPFANADGREVATLPATVPGLWQARFGAQTAYAAAAPADPVEWSDLRATRSVLGPVATSVHWLAPGGAPPLSSFALNHRQAMRLTGLRQTPLLPPWAALPLLLAFILVGWRREGR